jgi:hypothetical protein
MTQLRATCQDTGNDVVSTVTFTVVALRKDAGPARQVILPYFDVALRGGATIAAKQVGAVALNFPAGSQHTYTRGQATVRVNRGAAALPANVRAILTRPRKAGEADAAVDPMAEPMSGALESPTGRSSRRSPGRHRTSSSTTRRAKFSPQLALTTRVGQPRHAASPEACSRKAARESFAVTLG